MMRRLFAGIAGIAGVGGAVAFASSIHDEGWWVGLVPLGFLVLAAFAVHSARLGAQLIARAAWWANLGLGTFVALVGGPEGSPSGYALAVCCGLALLVTGNDGVDEASERDGFAPVAFRTTFLLLMVLVLADIQTFGLLTVIVGQDGPLRREGLLFAGATLAYLVAFVGIYRLTLWGAVISFVTAIVLVFGIQSVSNDGARWFVTLLALLQMAVSLPMLVAVATKTRIPELRPRARLWCSRVVIVGLFLVATVGWLAARSIRY